MSNCSRCGTVEDVDNGVIIGQLDHWDETFCNRCRADELASETPLTEQEAEIKAVSQLSEYSFDAIADFLDIDESTVEMKLRVVQKRIKNEQLSELELIEQNLS